VLTWTTSNQESRVTSYSLRNSLDPGSSAPTPTSPSFGNRRRTSRGTALPGLSNVLASSTQNFAAFKVPPVDPTRTRGETSDQYVELSDEMQRASSCREAVDLIVDKIQDACEDVGGRHGGFVTAEDVVRSVSILFYSFLFHFVGSLSNARRMTSVYAKMEYGVKRLLWLGSG
jgi:hypothetical protein